MNIAAFVTAHINELAENIRMFPPQHEYHPEDAPIKMLNALARLLVVDHAKRRNSPDPNPTAETLREVPIESVVGLGCLEAICGALALARTYSACPEHSSPLIAAACMSQMETLYYS